MYVGKPECTSVYSIIIMAVVRLFTISDPRPHILEALSLAMASSSI